MARVFSSGFELNSLTAAMEWDAAVGATISSATVRSGTYSGRVSSLASGTNQRFRIQYRAAANDGPFYFRFYFRVATLPSAENRIFAASGSTTAGTSVAAYMTIDNGGLLRFYTTDGQIGSASAALSTNTWYRIGVLIDRTPASGSRVARARIDGVEFAGASNLAIANNFFHAYYGGNLNSEAQTTGDWFFDDIAINDSTGAQQNTYPGSGKIIHLKPDATGDSNTFATQVGGTAGAANNFSRVNEVPPNDATSYNASSTLSQEDLFNVDASGVPATDVVNVVAVGARFANLVGADGTAAFRVQLEKTTGGTKAQSGNIIPNSTTWRTNASATPFIHPLVTYADPDTAAWTSATLDTMQIGYVISAANTQAIAVSNVWAMVEHTPAAAASTSSLTLLGVG